MPRTKQRRRSGWQQILAAVLVVAMLAGIITTDYSILRRRDAAYQGQEAYAYLKTHMNYLAEGWFDYLSNGLALCFTGEESLAGCLRRAGQGMSKGDVEDALQWMNKGLSLNGEMKEDDRARQQMIAACLASLLRKTGEAKTKAQLAAELLPGDAEIQKLLYSMALDAGDSAAAARALTNYLQATQADDRWREVADLYMLTNDYADSARYYTLAMKQAGETPELLYQRGMCALFQGQHKAALEDLSRSDYPGSLYARGVCHLSLGETQEAQACFAASVASGEEENQARMMLAICKLELNAYAEAEALLNDYVAQGGRTADIAYYRAMARAMQADYEGAMADYDLASQEGAFVAESLFGAAHCRYAVGAYEQAANGFQACIDQNIRATESWYYLGLSLQELGQAEQAEEALLTALSLDGKTAMGGQ